MGVTKRATMSVVLPVTVDLLVEVDDEGDAEITGVLSANVNRPSPRAIQEALTEDDWTELFKKLEGK